MKNTISHFDTGSMEGKYREKLYAILCEMLSKYREDRTFLRFSTPKPKHIVDFVKLKLGEVGLKKMFEDLADLLNERAYVEGTGIKDHDIDKYMNMSQSSMDNVYHIIKKKNGMEFQTGLSKRLEVLRREMVADRRDVALGIVQAS